MNQAAHVSGPIVIEFPEMLIGAVFGATLGQVRSSFRAGQTLGGCDWIEKVDGSSLREPRKRLHPVWMKTAKATSKGGGKMRTFLTSAAQNWLGNTPPLRALGRVATPQRSIRRTSPEAGSWRGASLDPLPEPWLGSFS